MLSAFIQGAREAHSMFLDKNVQAMIDKSFTSHHGKPIGIALSKEGLEKTLNKISQKLRNSWVGSKEHKRNFQTVIDSGAHKGRMRMDSETSISGFEKQFDKGGQISSSFWESTFEKCKMALGLWVTKNGRRMVPIVTVNY
jgi:hypothetical protein